MAKKEFNNEVDIRNFKSKIFLLPKKLQLEIQQMADDGKREWAIENHLKANYKGTLGTPTPPTIGTWLDWYEARKRISAASGTIIEPTRTEMAIVEKSELQTYSAERISILDSNTDISNKKELLERLIKKCIQRMRHIESLQEMEGTVASLEAVVGNYAREIHSLVQTQLKLSGELKEESNEHVTKLLGDNMYKMIQIFFTSINEIVPDKADLLKESILKKIEESKLNIEPLS
jgi:hypothetical protein